MRSTVKRILFALIAVMVLLSSLTVGVSAADNTESAKTFDSFDGLKVIFCGDSITRATVDNVGWPGRIAKKYNFRACENFGVSGAIVTQAGNNILSQVLKAYSKHKDADIIILHGVTNDAWQGIPMGVMTEGFEPKAFDKTTFAGGLESLIYYTKGRYPNAAIGYIVNFKFREAPENLENMEPYVDLTIQILEKWDIPYADLYHNETLSNRLKPGIHFRDDINVHPNAKGYDIITPFITKWMEDTFIKKAVETTAPETSAPEATEADTTSPQTTAAETTAADTSASSEDGCGSAAALSLIPSAVALCAVFGRKRK
jgi:lysophospholipase L1-like esterase